MPIIAQTPDATGIANAQSQANAVSASAQTTIAPKQFVYFAAFDGTNNDRNAVYKSGNPQDTNVAQLEAQVSENAKATGNSNIKTGYFAGPGTDGPFDASSVIPTSKIIDIANDAYTKFAREASDWLKENPGGEVTAAFASFSRGGAVAAVFSQILYEKGLVDPETGQVLIAPGQVGISAGVSFDPVGTGVDGNVAFAPNVQNVVVIRSANEYRNLFEAIDYSGQPGITTLLMMGNHCDIGGGYDNGLGALSLEASTLFLKNAGLGIADVAPGRQFVAGQTAVHDESFDLGIDENTSNMVLKRVWASYGTADAGTARATDASRTVASATTQYNPDGSVQTNFTNYKGQLVSSTQTTNPDSSTTVLVAIKGGDPLQVISQTQLYTSADGNTKVLSVDNGNGIWQQTTAVKTPFGDG